MHKKTSAPLAPWPQHHYLSKPRGGGLEGFAYKDRARPPPPPPCLTLQSAGRLGEGGQVLDDECNGHRGCQFEHPHILGGAIKAE